MADDTQARAQRVWTEMGGLGPPPCHLVDSYGDGDEPTEAALRNARQEVAFDRHSLRMRLIEAALPGVVSQVTVQAHTHEYVASAAVGIADAVLARLEAEAKAGGGG